MKRKSEKIIDALGNIDDNYVLECVPLLFAPPRRRRTPWLLIAACIALCILACPKAWPYISEYMLSNPDREEVQLDNPSQEDVQPSVPDNETVLPELPMLTLGSQFVGQGQNIQITYSGVEQLELAGLQDMEALPETLPVYENVCYENEGGMYDGWTPDFEGMENTLRQVAVQIGLDGEIEDRTTALYMGMADGTWAAVDFRGNTTINLSVPLALPEDCTNETLEGAENTAAYLLETYGSQLDMEAPEAILIGGAVVDTERTYEICIYDGSGTQEEQLLRQTFDCVRFRLDQDGVSYITVRRQQVGEKIGDYPILSAEEAEQLFLAGYGMTSVWEIPNDPEVEAVSVVYLNMGWFDCYMPFYQFLVPVETETDGACGYGTFYLPAVRPEYISDNRFWKTPDTEMTFEEKVWAAPDPDKVGDVAKEAFIAYFQENPEVMEAYGDYDLAFYLFSAETENIAAMRCDGPLMVTTGDSQTFLYYASDGRVEFGPSGTWSPEAFDPAEAIRRMLTERDPASKDYETYLRAAFARYYIQWAQELQFLPEFDENTEADWEDLSFYIAFFTRGDTSFSAEELPERVEQYMDGIRYTPGASTWIAYEDGTYSILPMDMELDCVFYRLTELEALEDGVYRASFEGFKVTYEEINLGNYQNLESQNLNLLLQYTGLPAESVEWEDIRINGILPSLWEIPLSLEEQGFEVDEHVTVTFRLQEWPHPPQDSDHPFQYLSCQRD